MTRRAQNALVLLMASGALLLLVDTQTNLLRGLSATHVPRARCYGLALATANHCAMHDYACTNATRTTPDASSWMALPEGLCTRLGGKEGAP